MPGGIPSPPKPPAAPTKSDAANNILTQGLKKPPIGFDSTNKGNNAPLGPAASTKKTLLGE